VDHSQRLADQRPEAGEVCRPRGTPGEAYAICQKPPAALRQCHGIVEDDRQNRLVHREAADEHNAEGGINVGFIFMKVVSCKESVSPPKINTSSAVASGTAGSFCVAANDTQSAAATATINTNVAVKSPPFGPFKICAGKKGATMGANNFDRALAIKNRIKGPISTVNLSQGGWRCSRFRPETPVSILFMRLDPYKTQVAKHFHASPLEANPNSQVPQSRASKASRSPTPSPIPMKSTIKCRIHELHAFLMYHASQHIEPIIGQWPEGPCRLAAYEPMWPLIQVVPPSSPMLRVTGTGLTGPPRKSQYEVPNYSTDRLQIMRHPANAAMSSAA
jgi:hypothetical protein